MRKRKNHLFWECQQSYQLILVRSRKKLIFVSIELSFVFCHTDEFCVFVNKIIKYSRLKVIRLFGNDFLLAQYRIIVQIIHYSNLCSFFSINRLKEQPTFLFQHSQSTITFKYDLLILIFYLFLLLYLFYQKIFLKF